VTTELVRYINAHINEGLVDIAVDTSGFISDIVPSTSKSSFSSGDAIVDLRGNLVLPSFAEPHAHLDKAFLADRVSNPTGDLMGAILGLEEIRESITFDDIVERSCRAVQLLSRNGVTAVRTHADTTLAGGLTSVLALLETKRRCAHFMNVQVAALLDWPLSGASAQPRLELARAAIEAGVDVIGGCPHLDENPHQAIDILLSLAIESDLPLDLHADENLRPTSDDLEYLADTILRNNIQHHITASHCVSLSAQSPEDTARISEKVASANVSVVALPLTNLFLQSRNIQSLAPRGITPTRALSSAGVTVAAGADNLQDPFNLLGRGDPLETASLMVLAAHETPISAMKMVTTNSHHVISPGRSFLSVGDKADFVAVAATNLREAIAMGPPDRTVVYGGVVISEQKRNIK
jgi:cytosine deaminase